MRKFKEGDSVVVVVSGILHFDMALNVHLGEMHNIRRFSHEAMNTTWYSVGVMNLPEDMLEFSIIHDSPLMKAIS